MRPAPASLSTYRAAQLAAGLEHGEQQARLAGCPCQQLGLHAPPHVQQVVRVGARVLHQLRRQRPDAPVR